MTGPKNKRRGAKWETDLVKYLRSRGFSCERLRLSGSKDEGDIAIVDSDLPCRVVLEAKAPQAGNPVRLSEWVAQSIEEAGHYRNARLLDEVPLPVVVIKAPNKTAGRSYVVMELDYFLGLK